MGLLGSKRQQQEARILGMKASTQRYVRGKKPSLFGWVCYNAGNYTSSTNWELCCNWLVGCIYIPLLSLNQLKAAYMTLFRLHYTGCVDSWYTEKGEGRLQHETRVLAQIQLDMPRFIYLYKTTILNMMLDMGSRDLNKVLKKTVNLFINICILGIHCLNNYMS